jgi:glutamate--cysteine ligase
MSDIGYKSTNQANLEIDYNSLNGYVTSLGQAIETPFPDYASIGVKVDGEYRQLNSNALQIENEYYSTVRPKQIAKSCEKPTLALKRRGVRYVEIRSLDLDLYDPIGINESQSRFIEALLLTCLLQDSPVHSVMEQAVNNDNQLAVAHQGRKPGLALQNGRDKIPLTVWAKKILSTMQPVCEILDGADETRPYTNTLLKQQQLVDNPELTPSAKILQGMRQNVQPFAPYALQISAQHKDLFTSTRLANDEITLFQALSKESFAAQKKIEANDQYSFDEFLYKYFSQTCP